MQKCKSFLSLCLFIVLLAACNGKKTASISDFSNQLYTPEYASGFSIKGADGYEIMFLPYLRSAVRPLRELFQGKYK